MTRGKRSFPGHSNFFKFQVDVYEIAFEEKGLFFNSMKPQTSFQCMHLSTVAISEKLKIVNAENSTIVVHAKKKEKKLQKLMQSFIRVLQKLKVFTLELGKKDKPKRHFTTNLIKQ